MRIACAFFQRLQICLMISGAPREYGLGTHLRDKFCRLKVRRGYKRAAVAIADRILAAIYHLFSQ